MDVSGDICEISEHATFGIEQRTCFNDFRVCSLVLYHVHINNALHVSTEEHGRCNIVKFISFSHQIGRLDFIKTLSRYSITRFVTAYTITMLCLCKRKNATFRYGVTQLRQFLQAERVDEKTVDKVLAHFKYLWMRCI